MKKRHILIFIVCSLFLMIGLLSGCAFNETIDGAINAEDYINYKCYDYHLVCLDAYSKADSTYIELERTKNLVYFRKPVAESDKQFVCARDGSLFAEREYFVMQNPEDYIDVLQEWTVKKIEFYYRDLDFSDPQNNAKPDYRDTALKPTEIIATTNDSIIVNQLLDAIVKPEICEPYVFDDENHKESIKPGLFNYILYIRVYFNESDVIVWETDVRSYVVWETQERDIVIDVGKAFFDDTFARNRQWVAINSQQDLYQWISNSIDETKLYK